MTPVKLMRLVSVLVTLGLLSVVGAEERPWHKHMQADALSVQVPHLKHFQLPNGIKVYYIKNTLIPRIQFKVYLEGGAFEEKKSQHGLTSLWGKCTVLSGSNDYPREKLAELLELNAASFDFSNGLERASYTFSSLSNFSQQGMRIVLGIMAAPRCANADLALLKKQSLLRIKKRKEDPARLAYLGTRLKMWEKSVYAHLSTTESVSSLERSHMQKWQKQMWQASRMTLVLTGDFKLAEMQAMLSKELGGLKFSKSSAADTAALKSGKSSLDTSKSRVYHVKRKIPQTTVLLRADGLPHHSSDYFAMKLFDFMLGGDSFNSHLMQQIRVKKGWAYSAYSTYSSGRYNGSSTIFTQSANANVPLVMRRLQEILGSPGDFVTEERLQMAKKSLRNKYVFLYETSRRLMSVRLSLMWDGMADDYLDSYLKKIESVSRDEVLRVAKKYYSPENFMIVLVGPDNVWHSKEVGAAALGDRKVEALSVPE